MTILTKNCPVGWAAVKQRVSRVATAAFSMIAGLFGGVFAFNLFKERPLYAGSIYVHSGPTMGDVAPYPVQGGMAPPTDNLNTKVDQGHWVDGRMTIGKPMITVKPKANK